jgi:hypothetical protein
MPTMVAHAAAVLPLYTAARGRLRASALVIGSFAPDVGYFVRDGGHSTHSAGSLLWFSLPVGLIAFIWLEGLIRPTLARALPETGIEWTHHPSPTGLPHSAAGWAMVGLAILLGATTHVLWDGFVHSWMWPADVLYPSLSARGFTWLHRLSSVVGLIVLVIYVATRHRTSPPHRGGDSKLLASMVGLATAGAVIGFALWWAFARDALTPLWSAFFGAAFAASLARR